MIYFFSSGRTALKHNQGFMQKPFKTKASASGGQKEKKKINYSCFYSKLSSDVLLQDGSNQLKVRSWLCQWVTTLSGPASGYYCQCDRLARKEMLVQSSACRVLYHLRASACVCRCFSVLNLPGESSASQQKPAEVKVIWFGSYYRHFTSSISVIIADWSRLLYREGS